MATTDQKQVRRDRVGVLASTIIRELAAAKIREIEAAPSEPVEPEIVMTPQLKRLVAAHEAAKRAERKAEDAVEKLGYRLVCNGGAKTMVYPPYRNRDAQRLEQKKAKTSRANAVRELRTGTLIDLVSLDEKHVKDTVKRFRAQIEAI